MTECYWHWLAMTIELSDINQPLIVNAVWRALDKGHLDDITAIATQAKRLSPEMQVYLASAIDNGQRIYIDLQDWKVEFDAQQRRRAEDLDASQTSREKAGYGIAAAVATAVNGVPVVGQALSAIIALGIAVAKALTAAYPLPVRRASDQVFDALEGFDLYRGLRLPSTPIQNVFGSVKEEVEEDPFMIALPEVPKKTRFVFAPTTKEFRAQARKAGLYESPYFNEVMARVNRA